MNKISLKISEHAHFFVILSAVQEYENCLQQLMLQDATAQRTIHFSIATLLRMDIMKKMITRKVAKKPSISLEVYQGLILLDAFHHFLEHTNATIQMNNQIQMYADQLDALLPNVSDRKKMSLYSEL